MRQYLVDFDLRCSETFEGGSDWNAAVDEAVGDMVEKYRLHFTEDVTYVRPARGDNRVTLTVGKMYVVDAEDDGGAIEGAWAKFREENPHARIPSGPPWERDIRILSSCGEDEDTMLLFDYE